MSNKHGTLFPSYLRNRDDKGNLVIEVDEYEVMYRNYPLQDIPPRDTGCAIPVSRTWDKDKPLRQFAVTVHNLPPTVKSYTSKLDDFIIYYNSLNRNEEEAIDSCKELLKDHPVSPHKLLAVWEHTRGEGWKKIKNLDITLTQKKEQKDG